MDNLRQRIPFKLSRDEESEDSRILDEQEQEEIIEDIRKTNRHSKQRHYKFLQGCLSFMILFQIWSLFTILGRKLTPVHILFPTSRTPRAPLIPFAAGFAIMDTLLLLNVIPHLPKEFSFPRVIVSVMAQIMPHFPPVVQAWVKSHFPLSIQWIAALSFLPAVVSMLNVGDIHQVIWWSSSVIVVGTFFVISGWNQEGEAEIEKLEKLKYEMKGA